MPEDAIRNFEKVMYNHDHNEANHTNDLYDRNLAEGDSSEEALYKAIEQTDDELANDVLGGLDFGYQVAKNAARWWNYTTAYLNNLRAYGGMLDSDELKAYDDIKVKGGKKLVVGNPLYFRTYDLLEQERVLRERNHKREAEPFRLQQHYAFLALACTIDAAMRSPRSVNQKRGETTLGLVSLSSDESGDSDYSLRREMSPTVTHYTIIKSPWPTAESATQTTYDLTDKFENDGCKALTVQSELGPGAKPVDACTALDIADDISNDDDVRVAFQLVGSALEHRIQALSPQQQ